MSEPIQNTDATEENNQPPLPQVQVPVTVKHAKRNLPAVRKGNGTPAKPDAGAYALVVERARQAYLQFGPATWQFS